LGLDYIGYYPAVRDGDAGEEYDAILAAGATPDKPWVDLTAAALENKELLYVADTYGVYELDLEHIDDEEAHLVRNDPIYSSVQPEEMDVIESFARSGRTVIAEFNTFALPTHQDVRDRWEDLLHVRWTGWIGRYIDDLGNFDDIPNWIPQLWEAQENQNWTFKGPGMVYADINERIVVLTVGEDLGERFVRIRLGDKADPLMEDVSDDVPYYYWFDVLIPDSDVTVHAQYVVDVTDLGEAKLRTFGIPTVSPAVTSFEGASRAYYFAGDFADNAVVFGPHEVAFYPSYRRHFPRYKEYRTNEWFYWEFYVPLLDNILTREEKAFYGDH
jgi:hypothetical protein